MGKRTYLMIVAVLVLMIGGGIFFFTHQRYSVQDRHRLKLHKINISSFADTDQIRTHNVGLSGVKSYQDQLIYFNDDQLLKVDPFSKKSVPITLRTLKEDAALSYSLNYEVEDIYGDYALICIQGEFKVDPEQSIIESESYTKKYYYGLIDLPAEKQIGEFIEFDSKVPQHVFSSDYLYIKGYGSPTAERSTKENLRSFILQIDPTTNNVLEIIENSVAYDRLDQEYFDLNNPSPDDKELSNSGTKQLIANEDSYTIQELDTRKERKYTFPKEEADTKNAYFAYSDEWVIEEMITYVFPYSSSELEEYPDAEYEDIPEFHYYLRNLKTKKRKEIDFGNMSPFFAANRFIKKSGYVIWLSDSHTVIKEGIKKNTVYRDHFTLPKADDTQLFAKEDGTVLLLSYDRTKEELLLFTE